MRRILTLQKDNKRLRGDQKRSEWRLIKHLEQKGGSLSDPVLHKELVELDNELKVLAHKADYLQEKLYKEQQNEREQLKSLASLKENIKLAQMDEARVIEAGKRFYGIDFEDLEQY